MKTNKFLSLIALTTFLIVLSVMTVSAAFTATLDVPAASSIVVGSAVNCTVTAANAFTNFTCNIYAMSASTANSSWTQLTAADLGNTTETLWNRTIVSQTLEDSNDYTFNASCSNGTDTAEDTNTLITVDNGVPPAPTSLYPTGKVTNKTFTFRATVTDRNTTDCYLNFTGRNPGSPGYNGTYSGSTCVYSITNIPEETYRYTFEASDGSNVTASSTSTVNVDVGVGTGRKALADEVGISKPLAVGLGEEIGGLPVIAWIAIGIVVIVVFVKIYKRR